VPTPAISPKPAVAFGGDCTALFDEATLSGIVGDEVAAVPGTQLAERVWAIDVLGGLHCSWMSEADAYASLDVIPAAGLEAQIAEAEDGSPYCECVFSTVVGGYWLSGIVGVARDSTNTAIDAIEAITARVAEAASSSPPMPVGRPAAMWKAPADCATFGSAIDTTAVLEDSFTAAPGDRGGEIGDGLMAAWDAVGYFPCAWSTSGDTRWFTSELLPGAGWAITELFGREGAAPVTVSGAVAAVAVPVGGVTAVYATDGVNLAWVTVPGDIDQASSGALVSALMAAASR